MPHKPAEPQEHGEWQLGGRTVPYVLTRCRRRSLGLSVTARGVSIRVPWWLPREQVQGFVQSRHDWIVKALARLEARQPAALDWQDGSRVMYLGVGLDVRLAPVALGRVRRTGRQLQVHAGVDEVAAAVRAWLYGRAQQVLAQRLQRVCRRLGHPAGFALSRARSRWGACHPDGRIRLNWRLIQAPLAVIDYVCAHEAAHLVHADHSPRFWALTGQLDADYARQRAWLREHGAQLFAVDGD
jgi:predicted metal-dependent hydrolase